MFSRKSNDFQGVGRIEQLYSKGLTEATFKRGYKQGFMRNISAYDIQLKIYVKGKMKA